MPLPVVLAAALPWLMGGLGFGLSGGFEKTGRFLDNNPYNDPSLSDWLTTAGNTALGAFTAGLGPTKFALGAAAKYLPPVAKFGGGALMGGVKPLLPRIGSTLSSSPLARTGLGYALGGGIDPTLRMLNNNPYDDPYASEFLLPLLLGGIGYKIPNFNLGSKGSPTIVGTSRSSNGFINNLPRVPKTPLGGPPQRTLEDFMNNFTTSDILNMAHDQTPEVQNVLINYLSRLER